MDFRSMSLVVVLVTSFFVFNVGAKSIDPYKVLGVDKNASQREIQKAFHKLSLQYHPDKNKAKGAQEKFAEINNAYEILSDEEKRKNYDLYGDEKGNVGFDAGHPGDHAGYTYFTGSGPGSSRFSFRPDEWQTMGGQGGSKSFSFSFGGPGGQSSFGGFGLNDIFSNFFGGNMNSGPQFGGFGSSSGSQKGFRGSSKSISSINSQIFKKDIADQGMTWILFFYQSKGNQHYEFVIEEVANSLSGAVKAGSINCESELSLCKELDINARRTPRLYVYSYVASESGSLVEYTDDWDVRNLKSFCVEHLPRFSKRVDVAHFDVLSGSASKLPRVMLLSTKKDTPVIWRVLSGLYRKRFIFYDVQVQDVSDTRVKKLGVDALPAVVGWLANEEKHILKQGISVKDLKSAVNDLSGLLEAFERKNKKAASTQAKKPQTESADKHIPHLTGSNFDLYCRESTPVCVIGAFRSSRAREKLETILTSVSQKSLTRRKMGTGSSDSVSYALLDATKQPAFLKSFHESGFKSKDKIVLAYKPRKGKFAVLVDGITSEEVEKFVGSVLNGDVQFSKIRPKPKVK
ncbi:DnaJ domain [Dillenia turbinata]|uniref:DnaJ domain n=1 Tax=Dillenia turbinata TaxID=194707 RepID=A0AAN8VZE0_9MAGN